MSTQNKKPKKEPACHNCKEKIDFTWDIANKKWILVEPFELDAGERQLRIKKVKIPYNPFRHTRHYCDKPKEQGLIDHIYRG